METSLLDFQCVWLFIYWLNRIWYIRCDYIYWMAMSVRLYYIDCNVVYRCLWFQKSIGHVSGGHINPAVTVAMLVTGEVSVVRALLYIIAQCAGAAAGSASLKALLPQSYQGALGHTALAAELQPLQGLGIEFFLGFILIFTVCGVCDPNKPGSIHLIHHHLSMQTSIISKIFSNVIFADQKYIAPLAIGLAVTVGHLGAIKFTGASMNPARSFGTAAITGVWDNHWVTFYKHKLNIRQKLRV